MIALPNEKVQFIVVEHHGFAIWVDDRCRDSRVTLVDA